MIALFWISGFTLGLNLKEHEKIIKNSLSDTSSIVEQLKYSTIYQKYLQQFLDDFMKFNPLFELLPLPKDKTKEFAQKLENIFQQLSELYPEEKYQNNQDYKDFKTQMDAYYNGAIRFMANKATLSEFLPPNVLEYFEFFKSLYEHFDESIFKTIEDIFTKLGANQVYMNKINQLPTFMPCFKTYSFSQLFEVLLRIIAKDKLILLDGEKTYNAFVNYIGDYLEPALDEIKKKDQGIYNSISEQVTEFKEEIQTVTDMNSGAILEHYNIMKADDFDQFISKVDEQISTPGSMETVSLKVCLEKIPTYDVVVLVENLGKLDPSQSKLKEIEDAVKSLPSESSILTTKKSKTVVIVVSVICSVIGVAIIVVVVLVVLKKKEIINSNKDNIKLEDIKNDDPNKEDNAAATI